MCCVSVLWGAKVGHFPRPMVMRGTKHQMGVDVYKILFCLFTFRVTILNDQLIGNFLNQFSSALFAAIKIEVDLKQAIACNGWFFFDALRRLYKGRALPN
jgi:hypothetical protein